jgi:hypothetical protein
VRVQSLALNLGEHGSIGSTGQEVAIDVFYLAFGARSVDRLK